MSKVGGTNVQPTRIQNQQATSQASGYRPAPSLDAATKARPIGRGHQGESVQQIQQQLRDQGLDVKVDGKFGPETERAVRAFQQRAGIQVDGLVGPETIGALRGAGSVENAGQTQRRNDAQRCVGNDPITHAPPNPNQTAPEGGVRAGDLQRDNPPGVTVHGPSGENNVDANGRGTARGEVGHIELPNGAQIHGPNGSVTGDGEGGVSFEGNLASLDNPNVPGASVQVGHVSGEDSSTSKRLEGSVIRATTGDDNAVDVNSKILDAGAEATFRASEDEGRIGAGYRANVAEVGVGVGEVSDRPGIDDYREEARVSAGVPSGGAFVSWNDRDNDGKTNYRLDIDIPIPGTPLGVGYSVETERPVADGLATLGKFNPITAPAAGVYSLGRHLNWW